MPRKARPHTPGSPHHLIARFVNREFRIIGVREREAFLHCLAKARRRSRVRICAYALMSSHVHIAAVGDATPLGSFLHRLDTAFARWWNDTHGGYGPVFAERPSSDVVDTEASLARLIAYIHNNPCRAGLVTCPSQTSWTSHRAYVGFDPCPAFLDDEWTLDLLGFPPTSAGRMNFHELVASRCSLPRDPRLSRRTPSDVEVRAFVRSMARVWGIDLHVLLRPESRSDRDARLVLLATATDQLGAKQVQLAHAMGLSQSFIGRLCKKAKGMAEPNLVEAYLMDNAG